MTSIEDISNELFHEIFDYLDGCEIFLAFSNLNQRFHRLLNSSSLPLKIRFNVTTVELYNDVCREVVLFNKQQISAIQLAMLPHVRPFLSSLIIDSSFNRLEALNIQQILPDLLKPLLIKLASLPRLSLLTIYTWNRFKNLNEIYRLIFALPMLKYYEFALITDDCPVTLPMAKKKQFNNIEHLEMVHSCTFNEIARIVSYTPYLNHLGIYHTIQHDSINGMSLPMKLSKLTHLSIHGVLIPFDQLEMFIKHIHCQLKVLHFITQSEDFTYLNADRWERFISENLPQLEEFKFQYYKETIDRNKSSIFKRQNQFTSPFWIARKWVLSVQVNRKQIIYSIRPYKYVEKEFSNKINSFVSSRKRWYEYAQPPIIDSSLQSSKSAQLTLTELPTYYFNNSLTRCIISIFIVTEIYHLVIEKTAIREGTLILLLCQLSQLVSLKIHSLLWEELTDDLADGMRDMSDESQITKMCLEEVYDFDEVDFLMSLSCRLNYFQINSLHDVSIELLIHEILVRTNGGCNEDFPFLCIVIPTADDELIEKLKETIDSEGLLVDYKINRIMDKIYLQWR
jgi:hypothetical protein